MMFTDILPFLSRQVPHCPNYGEQRVSAAVVTCIGREQERFSEKARRPPE